MMPPSDKPRISFRRILWPALILGVIPFVWIMGWLPNARWRNRAPRSAKLSVYVWYYLPTGWWEFLKRNVPGISPEVSAIGLAALCAAFAFLLLHFLARSFSRSWTWRSTLAALLAPALLFAIVLSAAGTQARITELATDPEPVSGAGFMILEDLREIDAAIDQYAIEYQGPPAPPPDWSEVENYLKSRTREEAPPKNAGETPRAPASKSEPSAVE